jgi:hypothetical protein
VNKDKSSNGRTKEIKLISSLTGRGQKREGSNRVLPRLLLGTKSERPVQPLFMIKKEGIKAPLYLHTELGKYDVKVVYCASEIPGVQVHGYMLDYSTLLKSKHSLIIGPSTECNWKSIFEGSVSPNEELTKLLPLGRGRQGDV